MVQVNRGLNFPIRKDHEGVEISQLKPFVEVTLRGTRGKSQVSDGCNPNWNEVIELNCYNSENDKMDVFKFFNTTPECVYLNVFDQVINDIQQDNRDRGIIQQIVKEKHWLGSFSIPVSTIYESKGINGPFKVELPKLHFGYDSDREEFVQFQQSVLYLSFGLQPVLPPKNDNLEYKVLFKR
jgi:coiled-coil and C2 domain-containing protein 2A